ncbi:MAG: hypothetical protein PHH11_01290 [Methylomonas sp.]|nr:hypothetical protein [Methylomonas sp.]
MVKRVRAQAKTASTTLRTSPRSKYGLELTARKQHRNVSGVIEWAIDRVLRGKNGVDAPESIPKKTTYADGRVEEWEEKGPSLLDKLWDENECFRFLKLNKHAPELMSYEEKQIWFWIEQEPSFWQEDKLDTALVEEAWDFLNESIDEDEWDTLKFNQIVESFNKNRSKIKPSPNDKPETGNITQKTIKRRSKASTVK